MSCATPLLEVEHLHLELPDGRHDRRAIIHDANLTVGPGEAVGLVGESGSGKSMTLRSVLRLLPRGARTTGDVRFAGTSVPAMDRRALRRYRAHAVAMVHQDPRAHINPLRTVGDFLTESLRHLDGLDRREAAERAVAVLREVGIDDGARRLRQHPHQFSGGLLQRVMIAAALLAEPRLVLADEPTTALDVTTQEEVMAILDELRHQRGVALLLVTHDLDLAAAVTDRIAVMYAGAIVEVAPSRELQRAARHPYTAGLLASRPGRRRVDRLATIPGRPVAGYETGPGCVFAARCPFVQDRCHRMRPAARPLDGHMVACHRAEELRDELATRSVVGA